MNHRRKKGNLCGKFSGSSLVFFAASNRAIGLCFLPAKSKLTNWLNFWGSQMQCGVGEQEAKRLSARIYGAARLRFPEAQEHIFSHGRSALKNN